LDAYPVPSIKGPVAVAKPHCDFIGMLEAECCGYEVEGAVVVKVYESQALREASRPVLAESPQPTVAKSPDDGHATTL
jgi:hypothetical protein